MPLPPNWSRRDRRPRRARRPLAPGLQQRLPETTTGSRTRSRLLLLGGLGLTILTLSVLRSWWRDRDLESRLEESHNQAVTDASTSHKLLDNLFLDFPHAVEDGLLAIPPTDAPDLVRYLDLVSSLLEDDYLLEMKGHHRKDLRDRSRAKVYSLHEWIAHEDQSAWRQALMDLLGHEDENVRDRAAHCLVFIARKIPDAMHASPLPLFTAADTGALLGGLLNGGSRSLNRAFRLDTFRHEVLRRPSQVRIWKTDLADNPRATLSMAFAYVERHSCSSIVEAP